MRKILITGGAGFIGSHLLDSLLARGEDVTIVDNLVGTKGEPTNLMHIKDAKYKLVLGDIRSWDCLDDVFDRPDKPYDLVFHLAAQTSVPFSVERPRYDWDVNVRGFMDVLGRSLTQDKLPHVVFSSSAAVYGSHVQVPTPENVLCLPESPYGASKLAGERMLEGFRSKGLTSSILRFSNVCGPRQTAEGEAGVVAIFTDRFRKNKEITVFGDGNQTRDFVYVGDVVRALNHVANKKLDGTYNVSTNHGVSINSLLEDFRKISGSSPKVSYTSPRKGDILHSRLDNSKLRATGWEPLVSLSQGITETYRS